MELAIPIAALGGLFFAQSECNNNENYNNMNAKNSKHFKNEIPVNYPIATDKELKKTSLNAYHNSNQRTDKYFIDNNTRNDNKGTSVSLTGDVIDLNNFKHNNQVPFFGSKIRGATGDYNSNEVILDNAIGSGSQSFNKSEQAPLFKPEDNVQWAYGAPNQTDFVQSRMNVGNKMANYKPWEETKVAPGLNKGFGSDGTNAGFNSGLEGREYYMPKNVDQLRVDNNPKLTFSLDQHQGPANYHNKSSANVKSIGRYEKRQPDTYYESGKEHWFTTTGMEQRPTARSDIIRKNTNQGNSVGFHDGFATHADGAKKHPAPQNYEPSNKCDDNNTNYMIKQKTNGGDPRKGDYGIDSIKLGKTNRDCNNDYGEFFGFKNSIGALFAPIIDVLRPSKKEDVVDNIRVYGQAVAPVSTSYGENPYNDIRVTNRQMNTEKELMYHNVQNQHISSIHNIDHHAGETQRETTTAPYSGIATGTSAQTNYESNYNQINNISKEQLSVSRTNIGNTNVYNNQVNYTIGKADCDRNNNRMFVPSVSSGMYIPPSTDTMGHLDKPHCDKTNSGLDRMAPDILDAFKANPFTHSLNSSI